MECLGLQKCGLSEVPLSGYGQAVAFNPATNKIYALAEPANELAEIDGRTHRAPSSRWDRRRRNPWTAFIRVNSRI